jgi:hypothetical protein
MCKKKLVMAIGPSTFFVRFLISISIFIFEMPQYIMEDNWNRNARGFHSPPITYKTLQHR